MTLPTRNIFRSGHAFRTQIRYTARLAGKQIIRKRVRDNAIDLFRHAAVETAQSRFDMGDRDTCLGGNQRRRHGGIHVAHNAAGDRAGARRTPAPAAASSLAVCDVCEPPPTPRLISGAGMESSWKKLSDISDE